MQLNDKHPADHRLNLVYRYGAGFIGLVLLVFGAFGFAGDVGFFSTNGDKLAGLSTNGLLSLLSILFGLLLMFGAVRGGNFASTLNTVVGVIFLISGFVNLGLLDGPNNFLAFHIQNVLFSFVVGLILMMFGLYGRVTGGLAHDNPYWRKRHPEKAAKEDAIAIARVPHVPPRSL
ncbi:DUF4383 domain-containing protein [Phaeacidiphilus oryzae]|uniref:DUF4383 domain-containing protein n=1 Tax=Phaeacidiphilus oryzae TaxID=348818 RepID=UPI000A04C74F|nr:DUF4383 domain-containing protein [Phaeacidiphilus oryzae]